MPNWDAIRIEWETTKITFKALAEKHGVKEGTLKSRRSREKWNREKDATKSKKDATSKTRVATSDEKESTTNTPRRRGGNPNPKNQFTKRNQSARKHGLFAKYLPEETMELVGSLGEIHPEDMIWDQIIIQYAAIVRAQKIMFVEDEYDHDKFTTKKKIGEFGDEEQYEIHTSWDKQATFLNAQSRAMAELRNLIKQFVAMADEADERRLKLEMMQVNIDKTNVEISKLKGDDLTEYEDDGFEDAILGIEDVWQDE